MKVLKYFLFLFLIYFISLAGVNAAKWSDLSDSQKSKYKQYEPKGKSDKIKEICAYARADNNIEEDGGNDIHYLYIYDDGSAGIGWNENWCIAGNGNTCGDGYKTGGEKYLGVRNWSKNSIYPKNGLEKNLNSTNDAYKAYESSEKCPSTMGKHVNYQSNTFHLSVLDGLSGLDHVKEWTKKDSKIYQDGGGSRNDFFYNIPLVKEEISNLTTDLSCNYVQDDTDMFDLEIKNNGEINANKNAEKVYVSESDNKYSIDQIKIASVMRSMLYLSLLEDDKCPGIIHGCLHYDGASTRDIVLYGEETIEKDICENNTNLQFKCAGDNCSDKAICVLYDEIRDELNAILAEYKAATDINDQRRILNRYNKKKDVFNNFCKSTLANMDYTEGTCVAQCVKGNYELASMETDAGMRSPVKEIKCNIGQSILTMVYNVLKWLKYIAPVAVIVLSILDFIKSMASQSDDEMKKAQEKFVKRLIVAVLLFLLPLIINFLLKTFGMYSSKCDITDLFS